MVKLHHRTTTIKEHGTAFRYELNTLRPIRNPKKYMENTVVPGNNGWTWVGAGTAVRRKNGVKEYVQVM